MRWLSHLSVKARFMVLLLVVVCSFGTFGWITSRIVDRVKVQGPAYTQIVTGKDLIADILPPPEYIIESYLMALELSLTPPDSPNHALVTERLAQLRKDFEDRQKYWATALPEGTMRELMAGRVAEPARRFFALMDSKLIPLVNEGKREEALKVAHEELHDIYEEHRAAINELVTMATTFAADAEAGAGTTLSDGWTTLGIAAGVSLGATVLLSMLIARSVTSPLSQLDVRMRDIAQGEGDLTKRVQISGKDEIARVASSFNAFVDKIEKLITKASSETHLLESSGMTISTTAQSLAETASEQASSLEQIRASVEEMSNQTQQSAEHARVASKLAEESKDSAGRGKREMDLMMGAVTEIRESSTEISKIIKVIDEIAFQTNLLALNAAVEAARAGESGKGFAVVADEVRALARRSADAAQSTSALIAASVQRSENGVQTASRVGEVLAEIATATDRVGTLMAELASSSRDQASGIVQINQGVGQLDKVTQQNAGSSEELAASAEEIAAQATNLNALVGQFRVTSSRAA